jgi:DNA-binding CsgD family transcriptional regulator
MKDQTPFKPLSPREEQVLGLIRLGRGNREIAAELGLSSESIKSNVKTLRQKLGVRNRYEAAVWPEKAPWWWLPGVAPVLFWFRGKQLALPQLLTRPLGWVVSGTVVVGGVALAVLLWSQIEPQKGESLALEAARSDPAAFLAQAESAARAAQSYRMTEDQLFSPESLGTAGFMLVEYEAPGNFHGLTKTVMTTNSASCVSVAVAESADGTPFVEGVPTREDCTNDEEMGEFASIFEVVLHDGTLYARECHPDETQCGEWQRRESRGESRGIGMLIGADLHATPDWPLYMLTKLSEPVVVGDATVDGEEAVHLRGRVSLLRVFVENAQRHLEGTDSTYGSSCEGDVCRDISFDEALRTNEDVLKSDESPVLVDVWVSASGNYPLRIEVGSDPMEVESSGIRLVVNYGSYNHVSVEPPEQD